jgi:hypothetical protein
MILRSCLIAFYDSPRIMSKPQSLAGKPMIMSAGIGP